MKETTRKHGYQRNLLSLSTPSKNRTTVGLVSKLQRRLATTALLGLAPVRSTRASAANHREGISACRHDDLGVANGKVTIEVTDYACPLRSCGHATSRIRTAEIIAASRVRPGVLLIEQF
jgi:hypothetical protein